MKNPFLLFTALLLCGLSLPAAAAVTAALDRDEVAAGDTVQLVLQHEGRGGGEPDLGPLKKDFDVLGSSSGSNIQFVNGHLTAQRELRLTLAPKHSGKLSIPALSWDNEQSNPLELTVTDGGSASGGASGNPSGAADTAHSQHLFLTSTLDQKQPYVQGAVLLTVQLHFDQPLYQAGLSLAGSNDLLVQQQDKDRQFSETRNGHRYDVVERKYLLQPQRSGTLTLDGPTLDAQVADNSARDPFGGNSPFAGMMNGTRPLRLHGDPIVLDVRPRPAAASGRDWLPATQLTLEEAWRPDSASVHAGEPLTLHLRLRAQGLAAAQLPDLSAELQLPEGLKAYPDQAKLETTVQSDGIAGSREQDIALIASRPGHYELPALRLSWWDTRQDIQREAVLPARTLDILPAAGAPLGAAPSAPAQATAPQPAPPPTGADSQPGALPDTAPLVTANARSPLPWPWISLALALLWLLTLTAWLRQRRRPSAPAADRTPPRIEAAATDTRGARKAFQQACRDHAPHEARRQLLQWARSEWPQSPPAGLNALAQRLDRPHTTELLQALDRACYSGGDWHGEELAAALQSLRDANQPAPTAPKLADLYP